MIFSPFLSKDYCSILFWLAKGKCSIKELSEFMGYSYTQTLDIILDFERLELAKATTEKRIRYAELTDLGWKIYRNLNEVNNFTR